MILAKSASRHAGGLCANLPADLLKPTAFVVLLLLTLVAGTADLRAQSRDITVEGMRSEKRVALVIGNASYAVGRLNNPVLDARAMAQTLRGLGFDVLAHENLNYQGMRRAVADFGERIAGGGVGLFYYSGHGLQVNGKNYLVPLNADLKSERFVSAETVDLDSVLAQMQEAKTRVNVVILDACRNNPFTQRFRSLARGLAFMDAPAGTYVAYATAPGSVAEDGEPGKNGIYTGELLKALREPGLRIEDVFKRVRAAVLARTSQRQNPWDASSLTGEFFFNLRSAALSAPPTPPIKPEIMREYGSLTIRARLPGIEVWLGEQKLGETAAGTAFVMNSVPIGTYRLKARKQGHKEWEREIQVAANQRTEVLIDIEPIAPPRVIKGDDGAEMVLVPAGEFLMGSEEYEDEKPPHRVWLDAFYIDRYEITNALHRRFMEAKQVAKPPFWNDPKFNGADQPVVGMSWFAAYFYCQWAGKRLPTEAEWEKAARGTDGRRYPWGNQWDPSRANSKDTGLGKTVPVGSYPQGASPYGVHDMAGNVYEWVSDWSVKDYYRRSPARNPKGPATDEREVAGGGNRKIVRGGSWDHNSLTLRAANRGHLAQGAEYSDLGIRCATSAP